MSIKKKKNEMLSLILNFFLGSLFAYIYSYTHTHMYILLFQFVDVVIVSETPSWKSEVITN